MTYQPKPIDTSHVTLSDELLRLIEKLAENNHDVWAARRLQEGWTYGPERNDQEKKHPDLVPYHKLTESEKDYDRESCRRVLETLLGMGYRIERETS